MTEAEEKPPLSLRRSERVYCLRKPVYMAPQVLRLARQLPLMAGDDVCLVLSDIFVLYGQAAPCPKYEG